MKLYIIFINRIIYRSYSCTFSRHGRVEASFTLLIWLNENVPLSTSTWGEFNPTGVSFYHNEGILTVVKSVFNGS